VATPLEAITQVPAGIPYGLVYQVRSDKILILAVMHLSRRPDYWRDREQQE
jgi:hypothetical protein